ncbi:PheS-related mystery ligase SrmL [Kocuria sabuli]|uniref:PheS-related mystery ligase SrmL n=1 Tax=Kocuria sabuli TaxID=3071448 RepID=UPI0034D50EE6
MPTYLTSQDIAAALELRDLTDPDHGPHAMQLLLDTVVDALTEQWGIPARWLRTSPLVPVGDNYDRLGFDSDAITRDARYSRYVSPTVMLRSHTSASIPWLLRTFDPSAQVDELHVLPGLVYRRDSIDRTHVGEPHQVDLWRVSSMTSMSVEDLDGMLAVVVDAVLPGAQWRAVPADHPYTEAGRQLDVLVEGQWLELAECGLIAPALLTSCGLDPRVWSGLALGMGLDRALMLRKGIDDIRLLRAYDPRIKAQMNDLDRWRPVSTLPSISRDISIVIDADDDDETLGDRIRTAILHRIDDIESVTVRARSSYDDLPESARARLGLTRHQVNALVRIVIRPLVHTLTDAEANELRDRMYLAVHQGPHRELIADGR